MWKIYHGEPQNLAKWPAEFGKICCGKLWSLAICPVSQSASHTAYRTPRIQDTPDPKMWVRTKCPDISAQDKCRSLISGHFGPGSKISQDTDNDRQYTFCGKLRTRLCLKMHIFPHHSSCEWYAFTLELGHCQYFRLVSVFFGIFIVQCYAERGCEIAMHVVCQSVCPSVPFSYRERRLEYFKTRKLWYRKDDRAMHPIYRLFYHNFAHAYVHYFVRI